MMGSALMVSNTARAVRVASATGTSVGFAVRVLFDGTWGYASSPLATEVEVKKATAHAIDWSTRLVVVVPGE